MCPSTNTPSHRYFVNLIYSLIILISLVGCGGGGGSSGGSSNEDTTQSTNRVTITTVLASSQEAPPVESDATGSIDMTFDTETGAVSGSATSDLTNATAAHIHRGFAGENGPVVIGLEANMENWEVPAGAMLSSTDIATFLEGGLYVNVHTDAHPNGEIRGQLLPENIEVIRVALTSSNEVPPVDADGAATAAITLNHDSRNLTLHLLSTNLDDATGAHIHRGFPGESGAVEIALVQSTTEAAQWSIDSMVITESLYNRLRAGGLYINVHSPEFPGGEVRGQVMPENVIELPGFQVAAQTPMANSSVNALPTEIVLDFNAEVDNDSLMVGAFQVLRAGGDESFTEGNEVTINIGSAQLSSSDSSEVLLDITGNDGPDDVYQITVNDSLQSVDGVGLDGDGDGNEGGEYQRQFTVMAEQETGLQPTFSSIQQNVFTPTCAVSGCHSGASPQAGMLLSAGSAFSNIVNVPSSEVSQLMRVDPGDPDNSYIIQKLEGTAAVGARMPFGGPFLSQDDIDVIRAWIADGAQDN